MGLSIPTFTTGRYVTSFVAGTQDLGPLRGLGRGAEDFAFLQFRHQSCWIPDRQPLVAGLLQLGEGGVLPLAGADMPAVVQRDGGDVLVQLQLTRRNRGLGRVECPEYLVELLIGCAGLLALEGD
jgi:hypothetical protein